MPVDGHGFALWNARRCAGPYEGAVFLTIPRWFQILLQYLPRYLPREKSRFTNGNGGVDGLYREVMNRSSSGIMSPVSHRWQRGLLNSNRRWNVPRITISFGSISPLPVIVPSAVRAQYASRTI